MISIFSKRAFQLPVNQIKKGDVISFRGKMYYINHYMQHSQGRGGSHYKVELKDVISGSKANERFNAGTMLEGVVLQERKFNFMYADEEKMHLIDQKTLEEFECPLDIANAGKSALSLLNDQCSISVKFHGELPLLAKLPERATFEIQETSPAISASSSESKSAAFKPALLKDSDVMIQVPDFINIGEKIVVDLNELKYIQRAK